MPVIQREVSVAANSTDDNLISGSTFEVMRTNVFLSMGVSAEATGSFITINSGGDVVVESSPPFVASRYPVIPDEMYYNDVATAIDRLVISARNGTGAAIVHRPFVQITNLN